LGEATKDYLIHLSGFVTSFSETLFLILTLEISRTTLLVLYVKKQKTG